MKKILWLFICLAAAGTVSAQTTAPVVTEAVVNAPVSEVWKAFTTREGMESWMVGRTEIDLQPGGSWRTSYRRESKLDDGTTIHHTILALDPERMLAYRTIKPPSDFPFPNAIVRTWTVTYLEPVGSTTKVTVRMMGFGTDEESQKMRAFFERGNQATIDSLVKKFK